MHANGTVSGNTAMVNTHAAYQKNLPRVIFWLLLSSLILFLIAFSTEGWAEFGSIKVGLWKSCTCSKTDIQDQSFFKASQAMFSIGLIFLTGAMILSGLYLLLNGHIKNTLLVVLIGLSLATVLFLLIGLLVFGIEMDINRIYDLSYSYGFACVTTILCGTAAAMLIFTKVNSKGV